MNCTRDPMPMSGPRGRPGDHQRPDGTYTAHEVEDWGTDYRHHPSTGYMVEVPIRVCVRCGREVTKFPKGAR